MILVFDNRDSFVHNLARYVRELGGEVVMRRSDEMTLERDRGAGAEPHRHLAGPCTPAEAGISTEVVRRFGPTTPILGVCLGHQCIGAAYGGDIVRAGYPMHGKTSLISHDGSGIFTGLPSPLRVARYHSLVIAPGTMPPTLRVLATADDDGEVMAVEHREYPVIGVQFHPESAARSTATRSSRAFWAATAPASRPFQACDGADTAARALLPWTPSEDMRWRPFVPPPADVVIIESIVTTVAEDGRVNCAPMGVEWGEDVIVLKPFLETATFRNVSATRSAVVNITDDVRVFARAAISNPEYPTVPAAVVRGVVLADCCAWRELEVRRVDATPPRSRIETAVVHGRPPRVHRLQPGLPCRARSGDLCDAPAPARAGLCAE